MEPLCMPLRISGLTTRFFPEMPLIVLISPSLSTKPIWVVERQMTFLKGVLIIHEWSLIFDDAVTESLRRYENSTPLACCHGFLTVSSKFEPVFFNVNPRAQVTFEFTGDVVESSGSVALSVFLQAVITQQTKSKKKMPFITFQFP